MAHLCPYRERASAAHELRAPAWRLVAVFCVAVALALTARLSLGPSPF